jgi:hypothetical protein
MSGAIHSFTKKMDAQHQLTDNFFRTSYQKTTPHVAKALSYQRASHLYLTILRASCIILSPVDTIRVLAA